MSPGRRACAIASAIPLKHCLYLCVMYGINTVRSKFQRHTHSCDIHNLWYRYFGLWNLNTTHYMLANDLKIIYHMSPIIHKRKILWSWCFYKFFKSRDKPPAKELATPKSLTVTVTVTVTWSTRWWWLCTCCWSSIVLLLGHQASHTLQALQIDTFS